MKISCCLITKKKEYPRIILDRLETGFFDEILIKTESPSVYERYILAGQAKNDIIYVQDDDCFLNCQVLFSKYNGRITNSITDGFKKKYEDLGCTLVGWGAFFDKSMLDVFRKYMSVYGVDNHLLREADRIFTYLNKPFNTIVMPHEDLFQNEERMSSPQHKEQHFISATEAISKCSLL